MKIEYIPNCKDESKGAEDPLEGLANFCDSMIDAGDLREDKFSYEENDFHGFPCCICKHKERPVEQCYECRHCAG